MATSAAFALATADETVRPESVVTVTPLPARLRRPALGVTVYREVVRRPWRVIYRAVDDVVLVVAVVDSRRSFEELLFHRLCH